MAQKKTARQILISSFMSFGRIHDKKDCEDYGIIVKELDEREEFAQALKVIRRYINLDKIEMNESDRKVVNKAYAKLWWKI